jgi:hypothetical protein
LVQLQRARSDQLGEPSRGSTRLNVELEQAIPRHDVTQCAIGVLFGSRKYVGNAAVVVPNIDRTLQTGNSDGRISRQERITRRSPDSAYGIEQPAQRGEWSDRTHAGIDGAAESDGRKCEYEWFWRHDQSASKIQRRAGSPQ